MSSSQNRYGVYTQSRRPIEKKTIPIDGDLDDEGRYFECWVCGFICDSQRDTLGDGNGAGTTTYVDVDGVTKYMPTVTSGCPLCGCQNYS